MTTSMNYDQKSVYQFKTFAQIFFYGFILVFIFSILQLTIIGLLITIVTTLMFARGIYVNSKSEKFREGLIIAMLFVVTIIVENLIFFLPSSLVNVPTPVTNPEKLVYFNLFANDSPPIIILLIIITITGGISAIWFNKWFKIYLPMELPQTNAYLIFGVIYIIANSISALTLVLIVFLFGTGNATVSDIVFIESFLSILALVNFLLTIAKMIAIYKIYNRLTIFYNNAFVAEPIDTLLK